MFIHDRVSIVIPQKWSIPTISTKVKATHNNTIKQIGILANNNRVMTKTQTKASPKFRHNSKPIRREKEI